MAAKIWATSPLGIARDVPFLSRSFHTIPYGVLCFNPARRRSGLQAVLRNQLQKFGGDGSWQAKEERNFRYCLIAKLLRERS